MIKQKAILVNKCGGQCKIESSCLFACEECVLDNFKEKESLDFKQPILVWGKFLILPTSSSKPFKFSIFLLGNRLQSNLGLQSNLSLRTPLYYGQFVWSQKCQKSYISYLYNTDTSARWTLGSVPLVSVLKRFDCMWKATKLQSLLSWYVVFPPLFLKKGQVNYLNSKGIKAANLDEGQLCKCYLDIHVVSFISNRASLGS